MATQLHRPLSTCKVGEQVRQGPFVYNNHDNTKGRHPFQRRIWEVVRIADELLDYIRRKRRLCWYRRSSLGYRSICRVPRRRPHHSPFRCTLGGHGHRQMNNPPRSPPRHSLMTLERWFLPLIERRYRCCSKIDTQACIRRTWVMGGILVHSRF